MSTVNDFWPHAPVHQLSESGTFIVTSGTHLRQHFFRNEKRLQALHLGRLKYAKKYKWQLEAWSVFSNHYHFVAHSPEDETDATSLSRFLNHFHSRSSDWANQLDETPGRKVWHNFWETRLAFQNSYFARLNYMHQNAVKHGLVPVANQYRWCSARWFEQKANPAMVKTIYGYKIDQLNILDDF